MSAAPNKKPSVALGLILILLLLAAVVFGGMWVVQAAFTPRMSDARAAAEAASAPAQTPVQQTEPAVQEPEPQEQPAQQPAEQTAESRVTLMALGDDLIHNCVYWSAQTPEGGYDFTSFFDDIRPTVRQYDLACINQETILVKDRELIESYPVFGSPIEVADALADTGFNVVTFASNHCFDKKETGITDTLSYFHETYPEITTLGIHDTEADAEAISIVEKNGIRIAMLNYTYGLNYGAPQKKYMVDTLSGRDAIADEIGRAKEQSDFVIVFAHWGEEGMYVPSADQKSWAQFFADHGVGLVIGAHPHVVQPLETVTAADGAQMPVFYSLGNFLSHQVDPQNMLGGLASVTLEKSPDGAVRVAECTLEPTINVMLYRGEHGRFDYRPMLLTDYTDELAARHHIPGCGVEQMWALFRQITGER